MYLLVLLAELVLQMLQTRAPLGQTLGATQKVIRKSLVTVHVNAEVHTHAVHLSEH